MINFDLAKEVLSDKECTILKMRYGEEKTLQEIGSVYGITRERVRQIINLVLKRLVYCDNSDIGGKFSLDFLLNTMLDYGSVLHKETLVDVFGDRAAALMAIDIAVKMGAICRFHDKNYKGLYCIKSSMYNLDHDLSFVRTYHGDDKHILEMKKGLRKKEVSISEHAVTEMQERGFIHYKDLAKQIGRAEGSVHNELIRSDLFYNVGRGMYGLNDGNEYITTLAAIRDVVKDGPLNISEIVDKVARERLIKRESIRVAIYKNLKKVARGFYGL
jgi:hypothetical protein